MRSERGKNEGRGVEEVSVWVVVIIIECVEKWDWKVLEGSRSVGGSAESDGVGEFAEGCACHGDVGEL